MDGVEYSFDSVKELFEKGQQETSIETLSECLDKRGKK